jgi:hypothetical protein
MFIVLSIGAVVCTQHRSHVKQWALTHLELCCAHRSAQVIVGDVLDYSAAEAPAAGWFGGRFGAANDFAGAIDDIAIAYSVAPIDGAGGVLGESGVLAFRSGAAAEARGQAALPLTAYVLFDAADADMLVAEGYFATAVLHEMGHALGFGYGWPTAKAGCGGGCSAYTDGAAAACLAQVRYAALVAAAPELGLKGAKLRQEDSDAAQLSGAACEHWR